MKALTMKAVSMSRSQDLTLSVRHLICAGWVGRDRQALQAHIDELVQLGVAAPERMPIYMNFSSYLLTTNEEITVISETSSGEVEYVLLCRGDDIWVTVGSDQTDRDIETKSVPASKQMYAKCLPPECWTYYDLQDHWDQLRLRCWVTVGQERTLYQEASLASILNPEELLSGLPSAEQARKEGMVLFSGTIPTRGGLIYGDAYHLELDDPVLNRKISHHYRVKILPQYL